MKATHYAPIPMRLVGPVRIIGTEVNDEVSIPLATYESPLWPSTHRGTKVSRATAGISVSIVRESMTRSIVLQAPRASDIEKVLQSLPQQKEMARAQVEQTSHFAKFEDWTFHPVGNLLYIRLAITSGDASGHNMATKAAEALMIWLLETYPSLRYVSISGNLCTDKKVSAVNSLLGRGKYVVADIVIPPDVCQKYLRTTPAAMVALNLKKNLVGSTIAGSICSANAHFANILLAFYLATGQDAANIIEGSQGIVFCEEQDENLYFSITLPNLILGSVGQGKETDFVRDNLTMLGCQSSVSAGQNARRLAIIAAAAVLSGELSLMAALTNPGELMKSHLLLERHNKKT